MKYIQQFFLDVLLVLCCGISLQAQNTTGFNPTNPPEPENLYALTLQIDHTASGSLSGGGTYAVGKSVWLCAYTSTGYRFSAWMKGDSVISTASSFNYIMPNHSVTLTAHYIYSFDPANPPEPDYEYPKRTLTLLSNPSNGGYFSNSTYQYEEGTSFYLYAYPNNGYIFKGWYSKDSLISTSRNLNYTMGKQDVTITGLFSYEPTNPLEPNAGTSAEYNLTALTQSAEAGRTIPFPIYLLNSNIDIVSAKFDVTFPSGVVVNYQNATLSSRKNGHTIACDTLGGNQYRFTISNDQKLAFTGSSGTLLTIPVTLSKNWVENSSYPVVISNSQLNTSESALSCPVKNGAIKVVSDTITTLFASFYPDVFLDRVLFSNLSSISAESFKWAFGDGSSSTEKNPFHKYDSAGIYKVTLTAFYGLKKDSVQLNVCISEKSTWKIQGSFTLDKNQQEVKNFTDAVEMFNLFSQSIINGDITVKTSINQTFDILMDINMDQTISTLLQKLQQSNFSIHFIADSIGNKPVLNFVGNIDQPVLNMLLQLGKYFTLNNVVLTIQGIPFNVLPINNYKTQIICSEIKSEQIDFTLISQSVTFPWHLISIPNHTTAYVSDGNNVIPGMTLINSSTTADTLTYNVQMQLGDSTFFLSQYQLIVLPRVQGELTDLVPAKNEVINSTTVDFSWTPITNGIFDLYLWEAGSVIPSIPTVSNLSNFRYTNSSFCQYGKSYKWKVIARSNCNSIESKVDSFSIRQLPDLLVSEISYPNELYAGEEIVVKAKIINKGGNANSSYWIDRLAIATNSNLQGLTSLTEYSSWHSVSKDSTYIVEFRVTLPLDTIKFTRFVLTADVNNNLFESDESNNTLLSDSIHIIHPVIDDKEYQTLCKLYQTTSGSSWTNKWDISSNKIINGGWSGITFYRGHVITISLPSNGLMGNLPPGLFTLPRLKILDLYDNRLSGSLNQLADSMISLSIRSDSLNSINLGKNLLSGEISTFSSMFNNLNSLCLANNKFNRITSPLSKNIINLNIQNQNIEVDSVSLSMNPELNLPTLCTYNHAAQSFDDHPFFSLLSNGNSIGNISYSENNYHLYWDNPLGWTFESGQPLVLRQETGLAAGSTSTFKLFFKAGDANIDQQVDILDVQQSLNYLLGENPQPFNFSAADTYKDTLITVQDIVKTVNIILSSSADTTSTNNLQKSKSTILSPNRLYIENNHLVLDAAESVSAMDVTLTGISDKQLRLMLNNSSFQLIACNQSGGGTRLIVFSLTGNEIKAGKTIIAELYNENVGISRAKLSDRSAQAVSVSLTNNVATGLDNFSDLNFSVYTQSHKVVVLLHSSAERLQATLYTVQGIMIDNRTMLDLQPGENTIDYSSSTLNAGVYILQLSVKAQAQVLNKTVKLIISK